MSPFRRFRMNGLGGGGAATPAAIPDIGDIPGTPSHRWIMDESSGTRLDSVGSVDLTDFNTVTSGEGYASNLTAAHFTRSNNEYLNGSGMTGSSDMSVSFSCWFRMTSGHSDIQPIFYAGNSNFELSLDASEQLYTPLLGTHTTALVAGTWYHLGLVHNATTNEEILYIDGSPVKTTSTATTIDSLGISRFGRRSDSARYLDGDIHDGILWKEPISAAQFTTLYNLY